MGGAVRILRNEIEKNRIRNQNRKHGKQKHRHVHTGTHRQKKSKQATRVCLEKLAERKMIAEKVAKNKKKIREDNSNNNLANMQQMCVCEGVGVG